MDSYTQKSNSIIKCFTFENVSRETFSYNKVKIIFSFSIDKMKVMWYNIVTVKDKEKSIKPDWRIIMTNAMMRKFKIAIDEFRNEIAPGQYVHGYGFRHYGNDYVIEENETEFKIYRCCKTDIYNTLVETITK